MFVNLIKNNVTKALEELIDEGIVMKLVNKLKENFSAQGIDITKQTEGLLNGAKVRYNFETKSVEIEFKKSF